MMSSNIAQTIKTTKHEENGALFEITTYNDISVIKHVESGYYNIGRICSDNGKRYPDISRNQNYIRYLNTVSIAVGIPTNKLTIDLSERFGNKVKGTYAHPLITDYVCTWANPEYRVKVSMIMNMINEELHIKNIKLNDKINEMSEELEKMKVQLKNANNCMKRIEGSIKIDKHYKNEGMFHLFADSKLQYKNEKTINVIPLYNAFDVLRLMNYYAKNKCVEGVKLINPNIFECSYENLIKFLFDVSENTIIPEINYDKLINDTLSTSRLKYCYKPRLFEIYCSREYGVPPFKLTTTEKVGLNKQDRGCDLLDIDNRTTGQCKYYESGSLNTRYLTKYFEFVDAMKYENNYLIVNSKIKFAANLELYDKNMNIITERNERPAYLKTLSGNVIEIVYVDEIEFEKFVCEVEDKYNVDKEFEAFIVRLNALMFSKVQKFKNEKAAKISKIAEIKAIEDHKKTIYEAKDDKFEGTDIEEQRKFLKELIRKNPSGIPFEECLRIMNERFNVSYNNVNFGHKFSDLYAHRSNSTYPTINGQRYILPIGSLEDEIDFIKNYIDIKDIPVDEYLEIHNNEFGQHYSATSFGYKFGKMFKNDGVCFARKTVDGVRIHVLQLVDTNRNERIIEIVNDLFNKFGELPVPLIVFYLRFKCRILYSSSGFMEEFKNFKYTCARFNNNRREAFDKFVKTFDENLKKIFDEKYKSTVSPNFIIG